jgi:hypothetical protein
VHAADRCLYRQACVRAHECACVRKPVRSRTGNVPRSNNALCGPTPHRGSRRSVSLGLSRPPIGMGVVFAWPHRDEWRGWRPSRSYPRTACRSRMPRRYRIARAPDARRWIPVCVLFQGRQPWRASAAWKFKNHRRHGPKQTQSESALLASDTCRARGTPAKLPPGSMHLRSAMCHNVRRKRFPAAPLTVECAGLVCE